MRRAAVRSPLPPERPQGVTRHSWESDVNDAGAKRTSLRRRMYEQLEPRARDDRGLSPVNQILVWLIVAASLAAIVETEPLVSAGHERLFRFLEVGFAGVFLLEYAARVWIAVENPRFRGHAFPRLRYALTPAAIIDLVAIVPALLAFEAGGTIVLRFFRVLRILRL